MSSPGQVIKDPVLDLPRLLVLLHILGVLDRLSRRHKRLDRGRAFDLAKQRRRGTVRLGIPVGHLDQVLQLAGQLLPLGRQLAAEASRLSTDIDEPEERRALQLAPVLARERDDGGGEGVATHRACRDEQRSHWRTQLRPGSWARAGVRAGRRRRGVCGSGVCGSGVCGWGAPGGGWGVRGWGTAILTLLSLYSDQT